MTFLRRVGRVSCPLLACLLSACGVAEFGGGDETQLTETETLINTVTASRCPQWEHPSLAACCASAWNQPLADEALEELSPEGERRRKRVPVRACRPECDAHLGIGQSVTQVCAAPGNLVACEEGDISCETPIADSASAPTAPSDELISRNSEREFGDIAHYQTGFLELRDACSKDDYKEIDFCYNKELPEKPSLTRKLGKSLLGYDDGVASNHGLDFEQGNSNEPTRRPKSGDTQLLPNQFMSADGRLLYAGSFGSWPKLRAFRPELIDYDLQVGTTKPGYPTDKDDSLTAVSDSLTEIHGLAFFNPQDTNFNIGHDVTTLLGNGFVRPLHTTMCEASSVKTLDTEGHGRNPFPCRARYGNFNYDLNPDGEALSDPWTVWGDQEVYDGLCYNVSIIGGLSSAKTDKYELRSTALTVFVPTPMRVDTSKMRIAGKRAFVYPQNPKGVLDNLAPGEIPTLPPNAPYDLSRLFPWDVVKDEGFGIASLGTQSTFTFDRDGDPVSFDARCYVDNHLTENPEAPDWCEFFAVQSHAKTMTFDNNRDGVANRPGNKSWDGSKADFPGANLFEFITTTDGRMLLMNNNHALYYAINQNDNPCSAEGFSNFLPLSVMPNDPMARSTYKVAQTRKTSTHPNGEPFRDPSGRFMTPGSLHHFAYPWMDRAGSNLFFAAINEVRDNYKSSHVGRVFMNGHVSGTPQADVGNEIEDPWSREHMNTGAGHYITVLGAWTGHKAVILDNNMNSTHFGTQGAFSNGNPYRLQYTLDLYSNASLKFVPSGNSQLNSFENRLNMFDAMRPTMPYDVVWSTQANNGQNAEVVFDEYMNPNAFVVAHMNASAKTFDAQKYRSNAGASTFAIEDGFMPKKDRWGRKPEYQFNDEKKDEEEPGSRPVLQNAASRSTVNQVRLRGGARIEPVALGGVLGAGVWLDGVNDFMDMGFPRTDHHDWYVGVWVDSRDNDSLIHDLVHFADNSCIGYRRKSNGQYEIVVIDAKGRTQRVNLGTMMRRGSYAHLGFKLTGSRFDRKVEVLINGSAIAPVLTFDDGGLDVMVDAGGSSWSWMTVGAPGEITHQGQRIATPRAWLDELRIYKLRSEDIAPNSWLDELICNNALGTLVDVSKAPATADVVHSRASAIQSASGTSPLQVCEQLVLESHNRPMDLAPQHGRRLCAASVHRNGKREACLRDARLGITPLAPSHVRPDTTQNAFCTSCHTDALEVDGLKMQALEHKPTLRFRDARRQPLDPPAIISLPPVKCDQAWGLDNTWHAAYPLTYVPLSDGTFATDHLFDESKLEAFGSTGKYMPPSR